MSINGAGTAAHTNNEASKNEQHTTRHVRGSGGTSPATKLIAVLSSFAMLVGIGFIGLFSTGAAPEAAAAPATRGQPVSHQDGAPVWTKITNQHAVWSEDLDEDGVYWIDNDSQTPDAIGATTAILWKDYNWSDDMSTYSVKSVLSFQRDSGSSSTGARSITNPYLDADNNLASLAIARIGGTQNNPGGKLTAYFWDWNAPNSRNGLSCATNHSPIIRVTSGDPDIYWTCMPSLPNGGTASGAYPPVTGNGGGTGGEIDQYTGNLYVTAQQSAPVDGQGPASYAANTNGDWSFMVWNPVTGAYSMSGAVQPGDWRSGMTTVPTERAKLYVRTAGTGNSTSATTEAPADFALDADGNVYAAVGTSIDASATATYNSKMVRMEPARDDNGNIVDGSLANPWRYYVVQGFVKDPAFANWGYGSPGSTWGNPFMNGQMMLGSSNSITAPSSWTRPATVLNTGYGTFLMEKLDPLTGYIQPVWSVSNSANVRSSQSRDDGSPQQAQVIRGTIYNDANGDGVISSDEKGLPGQQVGLYNASGKLLSVQTTDSSGEYAFIVNGTAGATYDVRPAQVTITTGGVTVNAAQTWGAGSYESGYDSTGNQVWNTAGIVCYNQSAPITSDAGDTCYGAKNPASADPPIGVRGDTSDPSQWLSYGQVTLNTSQAVPTLDFGFTTYGSYGDAAAGPATAGVPAHINTDPANQVFFGSTLGQYSGPVTNDSHATDDGVYIKSYDGVNIPLKDVTNGTTILAATGTYSIGGDISGNTSGATAKGWVTGQNNNTWGTTPAWNGTISGNKATGTFQYTTSTTPVSGTPSVQFRAQVSTGDITAPTNTSGQYYAGTTGAPNWTTPGEIEDYTFTVADSVYRPAVKTTSGSATIVVNQQNLAANPAAFTIGKAVGAAANSTATVTAVAPSDQWSLTSATVVNTSDGTTAATPTVTTNGLTSTITWTTKLGDDVRVDLVYGKAPDPKQSTLTLDKDTTTVGTFITATATVKDADQNLLGGQTVTFSNDSSDVTLSAPTCITGSDEGNTATFGKCSVTVTSTVAGTYTREVHATVGLTSASQEEITGSPATVTFTSAKGDLKESSLAVTSQNGTGPLEVGTGDANTYKATATVKDQYTNTVNDQEVRFTVTAAPGTTLDATKTKLSAESCTTGTGTDGAGKCSVTLTSTVPGTYMIDAQIQDPTDSTGNTWKSITDSPATRIYIPGPVCMDPNGPTKVQVTANNAKNDGSATDEITATTMDCYNNPVAATVTLSTPAGLTYTTSPVRIVTDSATGKGSIQATSIVATTYEVTATIGTDPVPGSPLQLTYTASAATPENSTLVLDSTQQQVGTVVTATVTAIDANSNKVGGTKVNLAFDAPTNASFTDSQAATATCTTSSDASDPDTFGTCSVTFTDTKPENVSVHARLDAQPTTDVKYSPATTNFITTIADKDKSTITATSPVPANGADTSTVTVTLKDKYENTITNPSNTVVISSSRTGDVVSATTKQSNGTYTATVKSNDAGTATMSFTIDGDTATQTAPVVFDATAISSTTSSWTVTPTTSAASGAPVANGNSTGRDYYTATLTAKDANNNQLTNIDLTTIHFAANWPTGTISDVTKNTDGTYSVTYSTTKAGNWDASVKVGETTITSTAGSDTAATLPIPFQSGPVCVPATVNDPNCRTYAEVNPNGAKADGIATDTIIVHATDKDGNPAAATFSLQSLDNAVIAGANATGIATVTTTADSGVNSVTATSTVAGSQRVLVSIGGVNLNDPANGLLNLTYIPKDIVISTQNSTLVVDRTSQTVAQNIVATVTAKDDSNPAIAVPNVPIQVTVNNSANLVVDGTSVGKTYQCTTGTDGTCKVNITDTKAEDVQVTATYDGTPITGSPTTVTFTAGTPDARHSLIAASPTKVDISGTNPSSTVTVTLRDQYDNVVTEGYNLVEILQDLPAGALSSVTKAADGTYKATLTSSAVGTSVVTYRLNNVDGTGSASVEFTNSYTPVVNPTNSSWTVTPTTTATSGTAPVANGNANTDYWTGVLTLRDQDKQPMSNEDVSKIVFSTTGGSDVTISDVMNTGNGTYTVKFTSQKAANPTASVTYDGTPVGVPADQDTPTVLPIPFQAGPVCIRTATVPCDPDNYTTAWVNPNGALADGNATDTINVKAYDAKGNPVAATFDLTSLDGTIQLASTSLTTDTTGAVKTTTATSTVQGAYRVAVKIGDTALLESPLTVRFAAGAADPDTSTLVVDRTSQTVGEPIVATVTARDATSNTLEGISIQVSVNNSATLDVTPVANTYGCVTGVDGTCQVSLTDWTAEDVSVTATVNVDGTATKITGSPTVVTFTAGPVCVPSPTVTCDPDRAKQTRAEVVNDRAVANGTATDSIAVYAFDAHGNPTAATFTLASTDGTVTLSSTSVSVTAANNTRTITGTSNVVGTHGVSVAANDQTLEESPLQLTFITGGADANTSTIAANPTSRIANGTEASVVTVTLKDQAGNALTTGGDTVTMSATNGAQVSAVTDNHNGTYTANLTSTTPGASTVSFTVNGTRSDNTASVGFTTGPVSAEKSTLDFDTFVQSTGGTITATVTARDANERVLEGVPIQVSVNNSATLGDQSVKTYPCVTVADGTCSVTITDTKAEPVTVTATVNVNGEDVNITGSPRTVNFIVGPPDPDQSTISADQLSRVNDGVQTSVVTVTLKDHYGNPLTTGGDTVTMSRTLGNLTSVTDNNNGTYTANLTSTVIGSSVVGYVVDGQNSTKTVTVVFVDTNAPGTPTITSPEDNAQINDPTPEVTGTAEAGSTVTVKDKDTDTVLCTTVADGNGNYSCTPDADHELGDGRHTLSVTAEDPSGNVSPAAEVTITVDTIPPMVPAIDVANGTVISGRADPGSYISVTVPGAGDPIPTRADENGTWTIMTPPGAIDDSIVSATATDEAGNTSEPGTARLDITAPPKPDIQVANATEISGQAEENSTVTVRVPGVPGPITTTAGPDGKWSIDTPEGAQDGGIVTATATDRAGNVSPQAQHELDLTPPEQPKIDTANATEVAGGPDSAEPGSTVTVTFPDGTQVITKANDDGSYSVQTPEGMPDGGEVTVTATDEAGNVSEPATHPLDTGIPDQPRIDTANATEVAGGPNAAEPGSRVTVTFPDGRQGSTTAAPDGSYSVRTPEGMPDGGEVTVTAMDEAGNVSEPATHPLDTGIPDQPKIDTANATEVAGGPDSAEPGSTVTVTFPDGTQVVTTANDDGSYSVQTPEGMPDGGNVTVTATDEAGNVSEPATHPLDTAAPDQPRIDIANATEVAGGQDSAEPGSTVTVTFPDGTQVVTKAKDDGSYSVQTPPNMPDGGEVTVTATDEAGNVSEPATSPLDTGIPAEPVIEKANGTEISGTADPGTVVTVTVPGVPDPITVGPVGDDGKWSIDTPEDTIDGGEVHATATDPAGNTSPEATKVIDTTAPDAPTIDRADATQISGSAEKGSTVTIKVPGVPDPITVGPVGDDEKWSIDTPEGAIDGIVRVTATDEAGNTSPEATHPIDVTAPNVPVVNASPTQIWGAADPGSTVTITVPGVDQPITIGPIGDDGTWSIPTPEGAQTGTVSATSKDASGLTSEPGTAELDMSLPPIPVINHANATHVAGDAGSTVPGNTVTVTFPDGQVKMVVAGPDGSWSIPTPAKADGSKMESGVVSATSTNPTTRLVSEPRTHDLDTDIPAPPRVDVANATVISGGTDAAEPGATVTASWPDGSTTPVVVNPDGSYTIPTQPGLPDGSKVTLTVTDPAGNVSDPVVIAVDTGAPDKPVIEVANGTEISGQAEPESTITIRVPGVDEPVTTVTDGSGHWTVATPEGAENGTIHVTATDKAGNTSPEATHYLDVDAPGAPSVEKANATEVSGVAEKGSTVKVVFPDGTVRTTTADSVTGAYTVATPAGMIDGGKVTVTAADEAGNVSEPTIADLDTGIPNVPTIDRADGIEISGTSDPGTTVTIKVPGVTNPITVTVGDDGKWRIDTPSGATDGTVRVTAADPAGNVSGEATRDIDVTPPTTPIVNPSNGSQVTGKGDPGSVITITDENDNTVMCKNADGTTSPSVTVDEDGNFVCVPDKALTPGSSITVVAKDASGLPSDPVTVRIGNVSIEIAYPERHHLDNQVVTGYRFNVGEQVCLVVHSDPYEVGCEAADETGTVTFTFVVPADFKYADHTATLTGQSSKLSASTSFTVVNTPSIRTAGTSQPNSEALMWAVVIVMISGSAVSAMGIRRLKVTK